jgi:hypothetical protein
VRAEARDVVLAGRCVAAGSVRSLTSGGRSATDCGSDPPGGLPARRIFSAARLTTNVLVTIRRDRDRDTCDDRPQHSDRRGSLVCVRQHSKRRRHRECMGVAGTLGSCSANWLASSGASWSDSVPRAAPPGTLRSRRACPRGNGVPGTGVREPSARPTCPATPSCSGFRRDRAKPKAQCCGRCHVSRREPEVVRRHRGVAALARISSGDLEHACAKGQRAFA